MPPRAAWVSTGAIGISVVFELQVKAKPVHFFKYVVAVGVHHNWPTATLT